MAWGGRRRGVSSTLTERPKRRREKEIGEGEKKGNHQREHLAEGGWPDEDRISPGESFRELRSGISSKKGGGRKKVYEQRDLERFTKPPKKHQRVLHSMTRVGQGPVSQRETQDRHT